MWRVQGGLSLPAVSHERRVMHPASPAARILFANMQKAPTTSSFSPFDRGFCSRVRRAGGKETGERERRPWSEIGIAIGVLCGDDRSFSPRRGQSSPAILVEVQNEGQSAAERGATP